MRLRHGMNPHQAARITGGPGPVRVRHGDPSYINLLDALNGWQLVSTAASVAGGPVAASFKHVSPAGVAVAGVVDDTARQTWGLAANPGPLASAYIRARDADPKSSFGDMIAVSAPVDAELASLVRGVVADGIIAPGFEPGTVGVLAGKKRGAFLILEADPGYGPPRWERREVGGLVLEQERDQAPIGPWLLTEVTGAAPAESALPDPVLPEPAARDALLGLVTLRYTQSNSVALIRDGQAIGIGAGQQNRVDCVKLAGAKARTWWLRRHAKVARLPGVTGMTRQDRLNWQIRLAEGDMTAGQRAEFGRLFPGAAPAIGPAERADFAGRLDGVTLVSDGYLPFRDNVEHARAAGVRYLVEPGGSSRSADVAAACADHGITLVRTGLRLFHH
jgi:phosphoribosylaminoimidazolecarboxamide formyltransferase / IMP cyclohydrolase